MKLFASLFVAWLAVAAAGCCHSRNDCCEGTYYGAQPACCNTGTVVPHGTYHATPIPAPAETPNYDVAPMPPK